MKEYWGVEVQFHAFFDLGTRWKWMVSFMPRLLYPQGKSPLYPLDRRLGGPQNSRWKWKCITWHNKNRVRSCWKWRMRQSEIELYRRSVLSNGVLERNLSDWKYTEVLVSVMRNAVSCCSLSSSFELSFTWREGQEIVQFPWNLAFVM
jgi:hypothetical protein